MSSFSTSNILDNQNTDTYNGPLISPAQKRTRQGTFKATLLPKDFKRVQSTLLREINTLQNESQYASKPLPFVIVNIDHRNNNDNTEEDDVSPEFIDNFNNHIGNKGNKEKARRLIRKMQKLGGLIPTLEKEEVDIPAARLGLSTLASLNNPSLKMEALDNLLLLLQKDSLEKHTSNDLVTLAISLMKRMNRELMQTEILDVQIKITQVYSLVAELLQRHYTKKHIGAITKDLKLELISTIKALEALNTQEDIRLNFYSKLALEGVRRIVDDRKELFDLIERFFHAIKAVYALQFDQGDSNVGFAEIINTFKDLDPHIKGSWYNGVLILNELVKYAIHDLNKLSAIQILIREKSKEFNWKFTYAAVEILSEICLQGETPKIRERAFHGIKTMGPDFPGLTTFTDEASLSKYIDFTPITHFKKPHRKNPNTVIRSLCVEHLAKIAQKSQDIHIQNNAVSILTHRLALEPNQAILENLTKIALDNENTAVVRKAKLTLVKRLSTEKKENILIYLKSIVPESKEGQSVWIRLGSDAHSEHSSSHNL